MWNKTQDCSVCTGTPWPTVGFTWVYALIALHMQYQIFEAINSPGFLPVNCSIKVALYLVNLKSVQSLEDFSHCWIQLAWKKTYKQPQRQLCPYEVSSVTALTSSVVPAWNHTVTLVLPCTGCVLSSWAPWSLQAMSHDTGGGFCKDRSIGFWDNFLTLFLDKRAFYCSLLCLLPKLRTLSQRLVSPAARYFHDVQTKICRSGIFRYSGH